MRRALPLLLSLFVLSASACVRQPIPDPGVIRLSWACWFWEVRAVEEEWRAEVARLVGVAPEQVTIRSTCGTWCIVTAEVRVGGH